MKTKKPLARLLSEDSGLVKNFYKNYGKFFEPAIEAAFSNIKWHDVEALIDTNKQTVVLHINSSYLLIMVVAIMENQTSSGQFVYHWQVLSYIVNKKSTKILPSEQWQRRMKAILKIAPKSLLLYSGKGRISSHIKENIKISIKPLNEEDLKVVRVASVGDEIVSDVATDGGPK